jgi:MFS transporter, FHS family, glucose/mannose:H+ symporter
MKGTYNRQLVFWTACLGMLLFGIGLIMLGSILPDLRLKHSLDAVEAGTLFSILPVGIILGSLLFGPVATGTVTGRSWPSQRC